MFEISLQDNVNIFKQFNSTHKSKDYCCDYWLHSEPVKSYHSIKYVLFLDYIKNIFY